MARGTTYGVTRGKPSMAAIRTWSGRLPMAINIATDAWSRGPILGNLFFGGTIGGMTVLIFIYECLDDYSVN